MQATATVMKKSFLTQPQTPEVLSDEQLVHVVVEGLKKLNRYLPYIEELKFRFDRGTRNSLNRLTEPIGGCHSWREFCEKHLDRTPQGIGKLLARGMVQKPVEITGNLFESFFRQVNKLIPLEGDGCEHKFVELAAETLVAPIKSHEDLECAEAIVRTLRDASELFLAYANQLEQRLEPVRVCVPSI